MYCHFRDFPVRETPDTGLHPMPGVRTIFCFTIPALQLGSHTIPMELETHY